jgi:protein tyrosine/serine phosphatase
MTSTPRTPKVLVPPINFSLVSRGVYRSGHPNRKNFAFLQGLSLKTVIYLESTTYRPDSQSFIDASSITLHTYDISNESKIFTPEGKKKVYEILRLVLDTRNHPLLIHDDMGKSVVSLICALVRRMERWSLTGIFAEGEMFAGQAGGSEGSGIGEAGREVSPVVRLICIDLTDSSSPCSTLNSFNMTTTTSQNGSTKRR